MSRVQTEIATLRTLRMQLAAATKDGKYTRAEHKQLVATRNKATVQAQALVPRLGAPALRVLADIANATKAHKLVDRRSALLGKINGAVDQMKKVDRQHSTGNPMKGVPGKWKQPFEGVYSRPVGFNGIRGHVVAIDLSKAGITMQANSQAERGRTVPSQAKHHHAEVAINGDFFSFGSYAPSGAARTDGKDWSNDGTAWESTISFRGQHAEINGPGNFPGWATNVVSGRPTVLKDGEVQTKYPSYVHTEANPMTGVGLSKSGRMLYLVVIDGRSPRSKGMTPEGMGRFLKRLGADDGLAMDAGGSATMYLAGRGVVNRPSDGTPRNVSNTLMIQANRR